MKLDELYDYILAHFDEDEPIFFRDIPGKSIDSKRQNMKYLVDSGKLERFQNGVYYRNYTNLFGTKGKMSVTKYIEKKYLFDEGKAIGYKTGLWLANSYGFTSQNPAVVEVRSNAATTEQRKIALGNRRLIVYKPVVEVNDKNKSALQLLDLVTSLDRYSDVPEDERKTKLRRFIEMTDVDFGEVKECLPFYPGKTYRNMYREGLMNELV